MKREELNTTPKMLRRVRLDLNTPAELAIFKAMQEVEKAGADVRLTEATMLLAKAKDCVADFIDGVEQPLPPAEGAEEIKQGINELIKIHIPINAANFDYCVKHNIINGGLLQGIRDVATLHAQKIADKMVEERLKNAPKNCPKAAQCAHVEGGMKCPPNVICPI